MHANRTLWLSLSLLPLPLLPLHVSADSPDAAVRVQSGFTDYAFEQKAFTTLNETTLATFSLSKQQLESTLPFVGTGVTLFISDFYLDLYAQKSFSGSDSSRLVGNQVEPVGGGNFNFQPFSRSIDSDWDRTEISLTAGYGVTNNFKIFAGFRTSETSFEQRGTSTNLITSTSQGFTDDIDYSQDGFFLGGSYAWSVSSETSSWGNGALSINAGLAFVDGEIEENFTFSGQNTVTSRREGSTVGLVLGLAWNGYLGKVLGNDMFYTAGLSGYRYEFEADNANEDADFSERVLQLTLGVSMPLSF